MSGRNLVKVVCRFFLFFIFLITSNAAYGAEVPAQQAVRVLIAEQVPALTFSVHGRYQLVDASTGKVIGIPREGELWEFFNSAQGVHISRHREQVGTFAGPILLKEVKHDFYIQAGNGNNITGGYRQKLAVESASGGKIYTAKEYPRLYVQGTGSVLPLQPGGTLNLVTFHRGAAHFPRTYRGGFEFNTNGQGLLAVNQLDVEEYLYGVVPAEMPKEFPLEALKAQAVAARSYLLAQMEYKRLAEYHVLATKESQVYKGYTAEHPLATQAVDATRGEVMLYYGRPINAFFHACSGGYTENSEDVWGYKVDYIRAKADPYDKSNGNRHHYNWRVVINQQDLIGRLQKEGYRFKQVTGLEILERTSTGRRVKKLLVRGADLQGKPAEVVICNADEVRWALGLKSAMFNLETKCNEQGHLQEVIITGSGWGHGLGMSQWGARGMAEQGYNYRQILQYYYSGVSIAENYGL